MLDYYILEKLCLYRLAFSCFIFCLVAISMKTCRYNLSPSTLVKQRFPLVWVLSDKRHSGIKCFGI